MDPGETGFVCAGDGADHCCYLAGRVCPYVEEDLVPGRRWSCGLLVRYGSWEAVNASPEYRQIGAHWVAGGEPFNLCEVFVPLPDTCCLGGRYGDLGP